MLIFLFYTTVLVFHQSHPNDFCRPPPLRTAMGHPPTTTHRYAPESGSIGMHVCMCKETMFVFHKIPPNEFCNLQPLRTIMGLPPTTMHRYQDAPGSGSIVLHVRMCNGMIFAFHNIHPDDFCTPPPLRTIIRRHPPIATRRTLTQLGCMF